MGIFNLCIAIPLTLQYGGTGCAFATGLSMFLGNGFIMNYYYLKVTKLDIYRFWKEIGEISFYVICLTFVGYVLYNCQNKNDVVKFGVSIVIYTFVYCFVIYKFCMNNSEKKEVLNVFNKFRK